MTSLPTNLSSSNWYEDDCESKVLIIVTGGTFIMAPTPNGLVVQPGYLSQRMKKDEDFHHPSLPSYDICEWEQPIDSSCIQPLHWIKLVNQINDNYYKYDGFIILHGTDTMAYTASALSFLLKYLSKPVVLTGAQIPIGEVFNDAKNDLIASLCVAGQCEICEVCLMFNNKLLRGNRATKVDAWHQDAFDSPNFPPLGLFGIDLEMEESNFWPAPKKQFEISINLFENIIVIWLIPGFNTEMLESLIELEEDICIVLSFYGVGSGINAIKLYQLLKKAQENHKFHKEFVLMSQCSKGHVQFNVVNDINYIEMDKKDNNNNNQNNNNQNNNKDNKQENKENDNQNNENNNQNNDTYHMLQQLNIMNAADMTVEAVVTKLSFLMGSGLRGQELKAKFEKNLRGELTPLDEVHAKVIQLQKMNWIPNK